MLNWTWTQYKAAGRHGANSLASAVVGAVTWGLLSQGDGTVLTQGISAIVDGIEQIAKGVALIAGVAVPIYTSWRSARSASPKAQAEAVVQTLAVPAFSSPLGFSDRTKLIDAVGGMPEVRQIIATPTVASNTESPKVVAATTQR